MAGKTAFEISHFHRFLPSPPLAYTNQTAAFVTNKGHHVVITNSTAPHGKINTDTPLGLDPYGSHTNETTHSIGTKRTVESARIFQHL